MDAAAPLNIPAILVNTEHPHVTRILLNRPEKRNAMNIALLQQMIAAISTAERDRERRALIFHGAGPIFCAGLDLAEANSPQHANESAELLAAMYMAICRSPLVTIAAAHGAAFGGGAGLIAACDFTIGTADLRLGYPEVHRGLVAALVTCLLRRHMSDHTLRELILLGQTLDGPHAKEMGLLNRVVPADQLAAAAMALAQELCKGAPGAMARTKRLLDDLAERPVEEQLKRAMKYHLDARNSTEATEGIAAFREKRQPRWGPRPE